jgi:hypothetical protein
MPKEVELDEAKQVVVTQAASAVQLSIATIGKTKLNPEICSIIWSMQHQKPPVNTVIPIKPAFGLLVNAPLKQGQALRLTVPL